jgi:hypothetical protein
VFGNKPCGHSDHAAEDKSREVLVPL